MDTERNGGGRAGAPADASPGGTADDADRAAA
jgi:hypothetical protein